MEISDSGSVRKGLLSFKPINKVNFKDDYISNFYYSTIYLLLFVACFKNNRAYNMSDPDYDMSIIVPKNSSKS